MSFTPLNKHLEIEPIKQEGFIVTNDAVYEEKGVVVSAAADCVRAWKVGEIVYFDSYLCAKFPDGNNQIHYLVQEDSIRAYEPSLSEQSLQ